MRGRRGSAGGRAAKAEEVGVAGAGRETRNRGPRGRHRRRHGAALWEGEPRASEGEWELRSEREAPPATRCGAVGGRAADARGRLEAEREARRCGRERCGGQSGRRCGSQDGDWEPRHEREAPPAA